MVERARAGASKVGGNGRSVEIGIQFRFSATKGQTPPPPTSTTTFGSLVTASLLSFPPSVEFRGMLRDCSEVVDACRGQAQFDPLQVECSLAQKIPSHGINTSFEKLP